MFLLERLTIMNTQTYASSKSLKGIDQKGRKGKHDDKDDFDGTPTAPLRGPTAGLFRIIRYAGYSEGFLKERPYRKGMTYNKTCVGPLDYTQV